MYKSKESTRKTLVFLFDIDDTVYDQFETFLITINNYIELNYLSARKLYVDFRKYSDLLFLDSESGVISKKEMQLKRLELALEANWIDSSQLNLFEIQELYEKNQKKIKLDNAIKKTLEYCNKENLAIGIITNGPESHQREKMDKLEIDKYFNENQIFISGSVGCMKPDTEIFDLATKSFDNTRPEFYMIGDSYTNDIEGAIAAGIKTIWLNKYDKEVNNKADYTVKSTNELYRLVKDINEKNKRN